MLLSLNMKQTLIVFFLLISFGLILQYADTQNESKIAPQISPAGYSKGLLLQEKEKINHSHKYNLDVDFDPAQKLISVNEVIGWKNNTQHSTKELYFHFYANAYKSERTQFSKGYGLKSEDEKTEIEVLDFKINNANATLTFPDKINGIDGDSTVARVDLQEILHPGDSVSIQVNYKLKIPKCVKRLGYAAGREFYFISQWFPKLGVFEEGKWVCNPYLPYLNFYSNFADYSVNISLPKDFEIASTGNQGEVVISGGKKNVKIEQSGVHDFVWMASNEIMAKSNFYRRKDNSLIEIKCFVQPERENYFDRYFESVKNCLTYFEDNVGVYPYQTITLVDVPRTSNSGGMEYPTLFTVSAELFSPLNTGWPEFLVAHEFAHQYFQGILANNEVAEAWLDEGFASYAATKIMGKYYPNVFEYFKIADHIPVFGINFFSYQGIPIIYTLVDIQKPAGFQSAVSYYRNTKIGSVLDSSHKHLSRSAYVINSYSKPELVLHTLENYIGKDAMMKILKDYYLNYKFKHPKAADFFGIVQNNVNEDMGWFFNQFLKSSNTFDDKIQSLRKINNEEWEVIAVRDNSGIFQTEVVLITEKDTLVKHWDSDESWKAFYFKTKNEVIAASIDPHRKNLLDINFSNNSKTVDIQIAASLSLSMRLFFWIQNALMIMGSVG